MSQWASQFHSIAAELSKKTSKILFTQTKTPFAHKRKKIERSSGEAIQKDILPLRMAGSKVGAVVGEKDNYKIKRIKNTRGLWSNSRIISRIKYTIKIL